MGAPTLSIHAERAERAHAILPPQPCGSLRTSHGRIQLLRSHASHGNPSPCGSPPPAPVTKAAAHQGVSPQWSRTHCQAASRCSTPARRYAAGRKHPAHGPAAGARRAHRGRGLGRPASRPRPVGRGSESRSRPRSPCLESLAAFLVSSSQSPSGPAGGAPDGYGLGRGAAGPRGATSAARARAELHARTGPGDAGSAARAGAVAH